MLLCRNGANYLYCCYLICNFLDLLFIKQIFITLVYGFVNTGRDKKHDYDTKA